MALLPRRLLRRSPEVLVCPMMTRLTELEGGRATMPRVSLSCASHNFTLSIATAVHEPYVFSIGLIN
jgi:hypothetical protein